MNDITTGMYNDYISAHIDLALFNRRHIQGQYIVQPIGNSQWAIIKNPNFK